MSYIFLSHAQYFFHPGDGARGPDQRRLPRDVRQTGLVAVAARRRPPAARLHPHPRQLRRPGSRLHPAERRDDDVGLFDHHHVAHHDPFHGHPGLAARAHARPRRLLRSGWLLRAVGGR